MQMQGGKPEGKGAYRRTFPQPERQSQRRRCAKYRKNARRMLAAKREHSRAKPHVCSQRSENIAAPSLPYLPQANRQAAKPHCARRAQQAKLLSREKNIRNKIDFELRLPIIGVKCSFAKKRNIKDAKKAPNGAFSAQPFRYRKGYRKEIAASIVLSRGFAAARSTRRSLQNASILRCVLRG